ncbi:hypothetical protein E4T56_gene10407 [Termitomyces sp. T112]|nr:hypothetical protein E4T56_gene10407 [Termitomyces sp. T112]
MLTVSSLKTLLLLPIYTSMSLTISISMSSLEMGGEFKDRSCRRKLATIESYGQRLNQYASDASVVAAHNAGPWITDFGYR